VRLPEGEVRAHCPNPGRLIELMNPGRKMILEKSADPGRKTAWTLAAAAYKGETVSLYSARANAVAGELIIPRLFPDARDIRAEYSHGRSRFDWHFFSGRKEIFLEVKACTLIEEGTAMFPDAPSLRASRHLEELAELAEKNEDIEAHAVFVIMNPGTRRFIPNMHTDPDFALTMERVADRVRFHGVSCSCTAEGELSLVDTEIPVLTDRTEALHRDSGIYMVLLQLDACRLPVGALGELDFSEGWYIYTGSAMKGLASRVRRHLSRRKRKHWHMDYLSSLAKMMKGFPIYTTEDLECSLADDLRPIADDRIPGFDCSDCDCGSHLFYFKDNPLQNRAFLDLLFRYRHSRVF
jgi:sugar fermentation stimulation protein A